MTTTMKTHIPSDLEFEDLEFIERDDLIDLGVRVLGDKFPELDDGEMVIDYRWKRKGGKSGGNLVMGKCVKLSGLAKSYAKEAHFTIWLAADHCRSHALDQHQLEALMFHELSHIEREEPEDEDKPVIYRTKGHDAELFFGDLQQYGAWNTTLQRLEAVVRQLPLPIAIEA